MSDNTTLNTGTGGDVIATEDIANANQQDADQPLPSPEYKIARSKIAVGAVDQDIGDAGPDAPLHVRDLLLIQAVDRLADEVRRLRTIIEEHL